MQQELLYFGMRLGSELGNDLLSEEAGILILPDDSRAAIVLLKELVSLLRVAYVVAAVWEVCNVDSIRD